MRWYVLAILMIIVAFAQVAGASVFRYIRNGGQESYYMQGVVLNE